MKVEKWNKKTEQSHNDIQIYRVGQINRGHSAFSQISIKLLRILLYDFCAHQGQCMLDMSIMCDLLTLLHKVAPPGKSPILTQTDRQREYYCYGKLCKAHYIFKYEWTLSIRLSARQLGNVHQFQTLSSRVSSYFKIYSTKFFVTKFTGWFAVLYQLVYQLDETYSRPNANANANPE